jgi:hypothetical protein
MAGEWISAETEMFLRFLDQMIDASASVLDTDAELASFAMMAALVAAERLGISDATAYHMRASALADVRRLRANAPR